MEALSAEIVANDGDYEIFFSFKILMGFILVLLEKQTYFLTKFIIFPLISNETTSSNYNKELPHSSRTSIFWSRDCKQKTS